MARIEMALSRRGGDPYDTHVTYTSPVNHDNHFVPDIQVRVVETWFDGPAPQELVVEIVRPTPSEA